MSHITMNNITPGTTVRMVNASGTSRFENQVDELVTFKGFTGIDKKYGEGGVKFDTLKECKKHFNVKTNAELEQVGSDMPYGHSVYAVFEPHEDGNEYTIDAYLYEGKWCICSSAMKIAFEPID